MGKILEPDTAYDDPEKFKYIYTQERKQDSIIPLTREITFVKRLRDKDATGEIFYYAGGIEFKIQEENVPDFEEPNHIMWPAIILYFNQKPITVFLTDPFENIHGNKFSLVSDSVYKLLKEHSTPIINK